MMIIKCLADQITDELEDAEKYIDLAMKWKTEQPETAELFAELSAEELGHMEKLHAAVLELIIKYKKEHGEEPEGMMVLYNYLHEKNIAAATEIKVKQGMYQMQEE